MLWTATREIRRAAVAEERRRREGLRLAALVSALDALLFELEELNLRNVAVAPAACQQWAADLITEASRPDLPEELPQTVAGLMERVYMAENVLLLSRHAS
jgi:uncharacterized protein YicC (UPF0701 family)